MANRTGLTFNGSRLVKHTYIYEPTSAQHEQALQQIFGRPVDGQAPLPDRPEYIADDSSGAETVKRYFNSLRYQSQASRPNWK